MEDNKTKEEDILEIADAILTEEKKNPNHVCTQLDEDEMISYNTGFYTGFDRGYKYSQQSTKHLQDRIAELENLIKEADAWLSFNCQPSKEEIQKFRKSLKQVLNTKS